MTDLEDAFSSVSEAVDQQLIASARTGVVHIRGSGVGSACGKRSGNFRETTWEDVETDDRLTLCRSCWAGVLNWEAEKPKSPVERAPQERADGGVGRRKDWDADERNPHRAPVDALPSEVVVAPGADVYHVPGEDGRPLCNQVEGDVSRKELKLIRDWRRPCRDCFSDRVVEEEADR